MIAPYRPVPRSHLYVPGDQKERMAKALRCGADAVIVDLEDAIAPSSKEVARGQVAQWLSGLTPPVGVEVWVRVNPGPLGHDDARAVVGPALTGIVAAKTETAQDIAALDAVLRGAEDAVGLAVGSTRVVPLVESARAVLRAADIAAAPRVHRLQVGEADLRADIGVALGDDESELLHVRSHLVLVSAASGLEPPVGPVSTDFHDLSQLRRSTEALARLGFIGRACIHPAQVAVINEVFTPDSEAITRARTLVKQFEEALRRGSGVLLDDAGRMVDEAVVRQARRILALVRPPD